MNLAMAKVRIDVLLVDKGLVKTRSKAKQLIEANFVYLNNKLVTKCGELVSDNDLITIQDNNICEYVSRGGLKLKKALDEFKIDVTNKVCLDIGASTGGFSDCLLKHGASHVYALDVGSLQLADSLKNNPKLTSLENINFKDATLDLFSLKIDLITIDVSFISLRAMLLKIKELFNNIPVIALFKPQFEVGANNIHKNGVVTDKNVHLNALTSFIQFLNDIGFSLNDITYSPITGLKEGNIEYLCKINFSNDKLTVDLKNVIKQAFLVLRGESL